MCRELHKDAAFSLKLPEAEPERGNVIESLRNEIEKLRAMKVQRDEQAERDLALAKSLEGGSPKRVPGMSGDINPQAMQVQAKVQEVYGRRLDYDTAVSLLYESENDVTRAVDAYHKYSTAKITFLYKDQPFEEAFNLGDRATVLLQIVQSRLGFAWDRPLILRKDSATAAPISVPELGSRTLQELGLFDGSLIYVEDSV